MRQKLRPVRIRDNFMDEMSSELYYEYLMTDAFNVSKSDAHFVNAVYRERVQEHPIAFAVYFHGAMLLLSKRNNGNANLFKKYADSMENNLTMENALLIFEELQKNNIPCINR